MKYYISSSSVLALWATTTTVVSSHTRDVAQPTKTNSRRHLRRAGFVALSAVKDSGSAEAADGWDEDSGYNGAAEDADGPGYGWDEDSGNVVGAVQPPHYDILAQPAVGPYVPGGMPGQPAHSHAVTPGSGFAPYPPSGTYVPDGMLFDAVDDYYIPPGQGPKDGGGFAPYHLAAPAGPAGDEPGGEIPSVELGDADYDYPISDATQMLAKVF